MKNILSSKEIAKLAGVSESTVSIVMNQRPGVSEETRTRILNIFDEHGIHLKKTIHHEMNKKIIRFCKITMHGKVINERHNVFISDYSDAIIEECNRLGYNIVPTNYNQMSVIDIITDIENTKNIAGCIILATELTLADVIAFNSMSIPHIFLDAIFHRIPGHFISMDNNGMTYQAINYLKSKGHKKIGLLMNEDCTNFILRNHAFKRSILELGLNYNEEYIFNVCSTYTEAYMDTKKLINSMSKENLPTAFFACNDIIAIGAMRAFKEYGIKVPEDISIIGFDNLPLSSIIEPGLTTMEVPKHSIGQYCAQMLVDLISKEYNLPNRCVFNGKIIERKTVQQKNY